MQLFQAHKENIWHFTCLSCKGYWSIATMDDWVPKKLFCPHCGVLCKRTAENQRL
jgi:rRNA maturation endonuclease Nob1